MEFMVWWWVSASIQQASSADWMAENKKPRFGTVFLDKPSND